MRKIDEELKVEMDGKRIAEQTRISTNRLNKLVLDNGIKLDGQEIKGVRSYSIKQDENKITAELTLFMDVRII